MSKENTIISLLKEINKNIDNVNDSEGTNANLEELTITSNGTYTPQEGVDGFSKVTARVVPTKRVVLDGTKIKNNCIDENGYWAGELVDVSLISNFTQMFLDCKNLKTIDVSNWDMSNATQTLMMFRNCSNLQYLDVSNWDVRKVTNMNQMFSSCQSLKILDVSNWDVSNVDDMTSMFAGCTSLEVLDVSNWDIKPEANINGMFRECNKVEVLDVGHFDVSQKTILNGIFNTCSSLKELNVSNWNVSNATELATLFYGCTCDLDLHLWDTKNVTNMKQTFGEAKSRKWLNISGWNASKVTDCYAMFYNNNNLTTFVGDNTLEDVINKNIKVLDGFRISSNNWQISSINRASLRALINGLADLTGETPQTLILDKAINKLTEEDIAIATAKNWTIA